MSYDGLVSRHLNRRFSRPMARWLARTGLTPNQVSFLSFLIGFSSLPAYALGGNVLGGLLAQLSSVVDGVDGEIARLKAMESSFGAFFDAILDRYADAAIVLGMILWAQRYEARPEAWFFGFLALSGSLLVSYSRARAEASTTVEFRSGIPSLFSRDVRLLMVMIGSLVGQVCLTLALLAVFTNLIVLHRLLYVWRCLEGPNNSKDP
jgi:phosphatidylglycerophosphate synthase